MEAAQGSETAEASLNGELCAQGKGVAVVAWGAAWWRMGATAAWWCAGGSDGFGMLSKEEQEAAKRYMTQWQLLDQDEHVEAVLEWLAGKGYIDTL